MKKLNIFKVVLQKRMQNFASSISEYKNQICCIKWNTEVQVGTVLKLQVVFLQCQIARLP